MCIFFSVQMKWENLIKRVCRFVLVVVYFWRDARGAGGCGLAWPRPRGRSGRVTHAQGRLSRGGRGRKARKVRPASPWPRWAGAAPPSPAPLRDSGAPDTGTTPRPHSPPGRSAARGRGRRRGRAGRSEGPQARGSLTPRALTAPSLRLPARTGVCGWGNLRCCCCWGSCRGKALG